MDKKKKLVLFTITFLLSILILPIHRIKAIGPSFEEGRDGFSVNSGESYTHIVTISDTRYSNTTNIKVGDKFRYNITTTNNTDTGIPHKIILFPPTILNWSADTIYGTNEYYNSTEDNWTGTGGGPIQETLISGYNSTHSLFTGYNYLDLSTKYIFIPNNFTAVNNTIVNGSYAGWGQDPNFGYSTPAAPSIAGTWAVWNGTGSDPGNRKYEYTFNGNGVLIKHKIYYNGTIGWDLVYESLIPREHSAGPDSLLLLIMVQSDSTELIVLTITLVAVIASVAVVILVIYFKKHR
ncbi:MAG: hypothetical protein ACTSO9_13400 [Candidatus Helarchaeota archaeon]